MVGCKGLTNWVKGVLAVETVRHLFFFFFLMCVRFQEDELPPEVSWKTVFRRSTATCKTFNCRLFSLRASSRVSVTRYRPLWAQPPITPSAPFYRKCYQNPWTTGCLCASHIISHYKSWDAVPKRIKRGPVRLLFESVQGSFASYFAISKLL